MSSPRTRGLLCASKKDEDSGRAEGDAVTANLGLGLGYPCQDRLGVYHAAGRGLEVPTACRRRELGVVRQQKDEDSGRAEGDAVTANLGLG